MRYFASLRNAQNILIRSATGNPTGLTGIHQHPNPRPALISLYNIALENLKQDFPSHSVYRQATEGFTKKRLAIVESTEVVEEIENKIGNGLIEELIIQANDEIELAKKLADWKV